MSADVYQGYKTEHRDNILERIWEQTFVHCIAAMCASDAHHKAAAKRAALFADAACDEYNRRTISSLQST